MPASMTTVDWMNSPEWLQALDSLPVPGDFDVIGIAGRMGSGKTYAATYLAGNHSGNIFSFAGQLKQDLIKRLGLPARDVLCVKPPAIRNLLQAYGRARRHYDPHYRIRQLSETLNSWGQHSLYQRDLFEKAGGEAQSYPRPLVIIDDVRYYNEAQWIQRVLHGRVIRLVCLEQEAPGGVSIVDACQVDESEVALDCYPTFTATIVAARGDLADLEKSLDAFMQHSGA